MKGYYLEVKSSSSIPTNTKRNKDQQQQQHYVNISGVSVLAMCSYHSIQRVDHYPIFARDYEGALGNETAAIGRSMGVEAEYFDIIFRYTSFFFLYLYNYLLDLYCLRFDSVVN